MAVKKETNTKKKSSIKKQDKKITNVAKKSSLKKQDEKVTNTVKKGSIKKQDKKVIDVAKKSSVKPKTNVNELSDIPSQQGEKKPGKKHILALFIMILLLLVGASYAFFNYDRIGGLNEIVVGKIYMHYNTNAISLQGVEPRSSYDPNRYIEFTIDGLNEYKEEDIWYAIDLLYGDIPNGKTSANRIRDSLLRFRLTKKVNADGEEQVVLDDVAYESINNLRLYVESIPAETENELVHYYKLYVWITDEIMVGNTQDCDYTVSEWNNLFASIKIRAIGDFIPKGAYNSVRVNFDANGGIVSMPYRYYEMGAPYGDFPVPEREDYTFDGWYLDNSEITSTDIVPDDETVINLRAKWNEIAGVAKINNNYYQTLQGAINAVSTNNTETTIVLIKNISECVTVKSKQNIKLNLRSNTVQTGCNNTIITNNGTINIINGTLDGGNINNAVVNNNSSAKVIVGNGGRIVSTGERGSIYNNAGTVEILEGAYLSAGAKGTANGRKLPRATINSFNKGVVTITGGTIIGVHQEAISNEDSVLTIGVKDGNVNKESPVIMGGTYGVSVIDTSTFYYYDGIIKGKTSGINNTTLITEKEVGNNIVTSEENINGQTYVTQHLGFGITITFNPTDGNISAVDAERNIESGDKLGTLPIPTLIGYRFVGWFTSGGNQVTSETVVRQNTTYYAHWEINIVAEINGKEYNSFQSAVDDVPQDNTPVTITITKDMTENITIKPNQNIVLDLENNVIENNEDTAVITNNGTIEIVSGTVMSTAATNAAINNNANGRIIIDGGRIITNADRGSIYNNGGIVEIRGDSYLSSTAIGKATSTTLDRATINNFNHGTVTITGGTIVGINQQAISNENATLTIGSKNGNIDTTKPIIMGKNYGVVNTGTFNFYDGTIKGITGAISGTISDQEVNSQIQEGVEIINNSNYKTKYLVLPN